MKTKKLVITALLAFVMATGAALALRELIYAMTAKSKEPEALIVYCFHGNERCAKCEKIEKYTREVLEQSFSAQLKDGRIVWRVVNYELPENSHFVDDYKIFSTAIVVVDSRPKDKSIAKNHQQRVWELVDNKEAFVHFIRSEIEASLK